MLKIPIMLITIPCTAFAVIMPVGLIKNAFFLFPCSCVGMQTGRSSVPERRSIQDWVPTKTDPAIKSRKKLKISMLWVYFGAILRVRT